MPKGNPSSRLAAKRVVIAVPRVKSVEKPSPPVPQRVFLLSPANAGGVRARMLLSGRAQFDLAVRLRREGLPLGEIFSFISGLYFRGKLVLVRNFLLLQIIYIHHKKCHKDLRQQMMHILAQKIFMEMPKNNYGAR